MALQFDLTNIKNHKEVCFHLITSSVAETDGRQTLRTEEEVVKVRDLCQSVWKGSCHVATYVDWESERTTVARAEEWVVEALTNLGLKVRTENRAAEADHISTPHPFQINVTDHLGNTAQFDLAPDREGFEITDATAIKDWGIGGGDTLDESVADTSGDKRLAYKPLTEQIIWTTLMVDIGEITEVTAVEFYCRAKLIDCIYSSVESNHHTLTIDEIKSHIGLKTNVRYLTQSNWLKKLQKQLAARLRDFEQSMQ